MTFVELTNIPSNTIDLTGIYNLRNGMKGVKGILSEYEKKTLTPPDKKSNEIVKVHLDQRNMDEFFVVYKKQIKELNLGSKKKSRRKSKKRRKTRRSRKTKRSRKR